MRVFIAGATGVLGRRLVERFHGAGHDVVGLSRDETGNAAVESRGGEARRGDLFDRESLVRAADGADVVVHAATAVPERTRTTAADWERNDRIRREGTRKLAAAAAEVGAERYLQQSVSWVASRPDGAPFDEDAAPNPNRTTQSALDGERIARDAGDGHGFDVGVLRFGVFYAHDSGQWRDVARRVQDRRMPILGAGVLGRRAAPLSVVHPDDAARAFVATAESDATGLWHVVDDEPVSMATLLRKLASLLGAPEPHRVPGWLARPLVGRDAVRLFTSPAPTANDRFRDEVAWEPLYPSYREGLSQVVEEWRAEGFV